ncbi:MAG: hypothetical protein ACE5H9_20945 [Anaerolineae bacterium]
MKTFYTERDIVDLHAAGVTELLVDDEVVLTDLAREKAAKLGLQLKPVQKPERSPASGPALPAAAQPAPGREADLASRIKAAVIARLGTTEHDDLLDKIIPQVLARLDPPQPPTSGHPPSGKDIR